MPANTMIVQPREDGHIDTDDGMVQATVGLSVETVETPMGDQVTILHLDVARDQEIETPFSVGIIVTPQDALTIISALGGVNVDMPKDWRMPGLMN